VAYSGEDLARAKFGPANPFKDDTNLLKRKNNTLTGSAQETFLSEHTFRSKHRAVERRGGPERAYQSGSAVKEEAARVRSTRQGKGNATVAEGPDAYVGPWAKYKRDEYKEVGEDEELASDEEYEIIEVSEEEEDAIESGTIVKAPPEALARRKEV